VVGAVGMIILIEAVTIIMNPITTVYSTTTIIQVTVDITTVIVEVEADFTLVISTEIIRVTPPTAVRGMGIRPKDNRTVRMFSIRRHSDGFLKDLSLRFYIL
jgi:hypothetical protein